MMSRPQSESTTEAAPVEVPLTSLSEEAASAVLESFILREGTDYGVEFTMEAKVSRLRRQIETKKAFLVYDPSTDSINFLTLLEWRKHQTQFNGADNSSKL